MSLVSQWWVLLTKSHCSKMFPNILKQKTKMSISYWHSHGGPSLFSSVYCQMNMTLMCPLMCCVIRGSCCRATGRLRGMSWTSWVWNWRASSIVLAPSGGLGGSTHRCPNTTGRSPPLILRATILMGTHWIMLYRSTIRRLQLQIK